MKPPGRGAASTAATPLTGIGIDKNDLVLYDVQNGLDNTLVIMGLAKEMPLNALKPFTSKETQEVTIIRRPVELGFPLHTEAVKRYFAEKRAGKKGG